MVNILDAFCWSTWVSVMCLTHPYPSPPETRVAQGSLQGKWFVTRGNQLVAGFLGIPYAEAPVGSLRFESPRPGIPWQGVFSATRDTPGCIQNLDRVKVPGVVPASVSEDCLHLNVYTPDLKPSSNLPVIVFIPGGSFESATAYSTDYGPEYIGDESVVLVVLNYRLGILGFLSLGDRALPGNLGLKDQREALRWVKANIAQFGGDPTKVTIMGQSAGAISAYYHLIFTASEGLFRAVIAESGSSRTIADLQYSNTQKPLIGKLRNLTNCPSDPYKLVNCLRKIPAEEFPKIHEELRKRPALVETRRPLLPPVIEPACVKDAVITDDPFYRTTYYPILQGANTNEGDLFITDFTSDTSNTLLGLLNKDFENAIPYDFYFNDVAQNPSEDAEVLRNFYFKNADVDRGHISNLSALAGEASVNFPLVAAARANKGNTFFYQLNYQGANTVLRYYGIEGDDNSRTHCDDLFFFFPLNLSRRNVTEKDTKFSKIFVRLFANFATYLDPTPAGSSFKWDPVKTDSIEFLNIGQDSFTMDSGFLKQRMDLWAGLPYRNKQQTGRPSCSSNRKSNM